MTDKPFLYVVVCGCGIAGDVGKLIASAQERRWDVGVIATPQGLGFLDAEAVEARTGYPVRSGWRKPGEARPLPPADAIAVAPATFNTVNKWAAGISDTLALGVLCEAYGMGVPTAVLPYLNTAQAAHPAYRRSLDQLREMGVLVGGYEPHRPKAGGGADRFRWDEALDLLEPRLSEDKRRARSEDLAQGS
ncbi:flavoprotein [Streptomyces antibioticus]|uniref:flavoprotein n=1 Tax=Streptomyces antibioticus TaxID=1890 RepID=UPI0033A546C3